MNKKVSLFILLLFLGGGYILNLHYIIEANLIRFNSSLQSSYNHFSLYIQDMYHRYLDQASYVKHMEQELDKYRIYKILYEQNLHTVLQLKYASKLNLIQNHHYKKVDVLSYYKVNDFSQVVLDYQVEDKDKIYPLISLDGYSAGVVIEKDNKTVALLNQNKRSNYTVFIGKQNAPGITSGMTPVGDLIIRYIPIWKKINIGDEVITSNMDSLFPYGIKVGKVIKISSDENTQQILVKPYAQNLNTKQFYIWDKDE